MPCDVREPGQLEAVFDRVGRDWGRLDFLLHAVAFATKEDLQCRVLDCSQAGFAMAMDISCHSFIRMVRLAEPLMPEGGCLLTLSHYGAEKVVEHYNIMGPIKAALEAIVRYIAADLAPKGIRVHAISPGPVKTRAASGLDHFDELLNRVAARAPIHHVIDPSDVGAVAAFLVGDWAKSLTGSTTYVDAGYHIIA
jgi:enoyl-[acyl-carrier protein] reductase I